VLAGLVEVAEEREGGGVIISITTPRTCCSISAEERPDGTTTGSVTADG